MSAMVDVRREEMMRESAELEFASLPRVVTSRFPVRGPTVATCSLVGQSQARASRAWEIAHAAAPR